jgi:hypothetical protein
MSERAPTDEQLAATQPHPDTDQALFVDGHGPAFPPPWLDPPTRQALLDGADLTPVPDDPHDHAAHPAATEEDGPNGG